MYRILQEAAGNPCVVAPVTAWILSQLLKFCLTAIQTGNFLPERLVGSGGMPSAHGATVCALTTSIGMTSGVGGTDFALAAIFALVVMYDARGVRREAGRHAKALNRLCARAVEEGHPISTEKPFHEMVGHTMPQVLLGAVLGILVAVVVCHIMR